MGTKIRRDRSDLPTAPTGDGGRVPDTDPWVGRAIGQAYLARHYEAEKAHAIEGTRFRASMAGSCTRALAYYFAKVAESDPTGPADAWRMQLGTLIHEELQAVFLDAIPGAEIEVKVPIVDGEGSMHIDIVVRQPLEQRWAVGDPEHAAAMKQGQAEWVTAIEVKSINGFGYKMTATSYQGPPKGPKGNHLGQAALGAKAVDADEMIVAYLSMENVGPNLIRYCDDPEFGRFTAQWTYSREEYMAIAEREERRVRYVLGMVPLEDEAAMAEKAKLVPAYVDTDDGVAVQIMPPASGQTVAPAEGGKLMPVGQTWHCGYCRWRARCKADG